MVSILVKGKPLANITPDLKTLRAIFGYRVEEGVPLAKYTSARIGGPAELLIVVNNAGELANAAAYLWERETSFIILGGGSNVLVSDAGVSEVVILNHARQVKFEMNGISPSVWAESGANLGSIARQAAARGLSGLEWAVGIPGTIGGAIVGNAGAHGSEIARNLLMAEILHQDHGTERQSVREYWPREIWF
jgi:UDP-N-acetylmuramate dehydrogenase